MICSKCGNELKPGANFCARCGARVELTGQDAPVPALSQPPVEKPKKKTAKVVIIAGIAAAVLIALVVSFFALGGVDKLRVMASLHTGGKYLDDLKYEEAARAFQEVIEIEPKEEKAYIGLADAYMGMGDYKSASEALARGLVATDYAEALEEYGYVIMDRWDEAEPRIYGTVLMADAYGNTAEPVADAYVNITDGAGNTVVCHTDQAGSYESGHMVIGNYTVCFGADGYIEYTEEISLTGGKQELNINLERDRKIKGYVYAADANDADNAGITDAYVYVTAQGGESYTYRTDAAGYYESDQLMPGNYDLLYYADGYVEYRQSVEVAEGAQEINAVMEPDILANMEIFQRLPSEFVFSSGAGGWGTIITLNDDGTFTGQYSDSDMGDVGTGYPNGTVYICNFSGKFTVPEKISEYIYSMNLESLDAEGISGTVYYEDGVRYVVADPYGLDDAEEFLIYLPGCPLEETEEEFIWWSFINTQIRTTIPAGVYGIYNVGGMEGFMGEDEDSLWRKAYTYSYNSHRSQLRASYYSTSSLIFWPETGAATLILEFDWSDDSQTEFIATDSRGTGEYNISLDFNEDFTSVMVTVRSMSGFNLEPWGGTTDGTLSVEYRVE